jgi:hypothetical protein
MPRSSQNNDGWVPYHFSAVTSPISPLNPFPIGGVCPTNAYSVYLARCNLGLISPTVPIINCIQLLPAGVQCITTAQNKADFLACDSIICIIQSLTGLYLNPIHVSVQFVATVTDDPDLPYNVITEKSWSASTEFLNSQTIMNSIPSGTFIYRDPNSVPPNQDTPIIGSTRILLINTNETNI